MKKRQNPIELEKKLQCININGQTYFAIPPKSKHEKLAFNLNGEVYFSLPTILEIIKKQCQTLKEDLHEETQNFLNDESVDILVREAQGACDTYLNIANAFAEDISHNFKLFSDIIKKGRDGSVSLKIKSKE